MTPPNMHHSISTDSDICVATQQKAVYNWYESHHSKEDVVDIYSLEWQRRITAWHDWFAKTYGTNHMNMDTAISFGKSEDLDFRVLFFAQPVATFSLWHMLQAFYEIDTAVCGRASDAQETLHMWREMKPLEYLKSEEVRRRWTRELEKLNQEIECAALVGGALTLTVYGILGGVEKLETSLASLEEDLNFNDVEMEFVIWILETIRDAVDDRCFMIANILKVEAMDQDAVVSEEDKSLYGDSIASAAQSLESSRFQKYIPAWNSLILNSSIPCFDSINFHAISTICSILAIIILVLVAISGVKSLKSCQGVTCNEG